MYEVWFKSLTTGNPCLFIRRINDRSLAIRIACNLVDEEFAESAWVEPPVVFTFQSEKAS